jgi:hypothetical protein
MKVQDMKFIYVFLIILSIYKWCDWINFFHGMVFEIILSKEKGHKLSLAWRSFIFSKLGGAQVQRNNWYN